MGALRAGCSLGVKLSFAQYENVAPTFWAGEELTAEESAGMTDKEKQDWYTHAMQLARERVEAEVDKDIEDVKGRKVFNEIRKAK